MRKTMTTIAVVAAALAVVASPASATVLVSHGGQGAYEGDVTGTMRQDCPPTPQATRPAVLVCTTAAHGYIALMPVSVARAEILAVRINDACDNGQDWPYGPVYDYSRRIEADVVRLTAGRFSWAAGRPYYGGTLTIAGQVSGAHASGTVSVTAGSASGLTAATLGAHHCYGARYSWTATWDGSAMPDLP
jgi:hypothetical protein